MNPQDDPRWRKNRDFESEYSRRTQEDNSRTTPILTSIPSSMPNPSTIEATVEEYSDKYKPPFTGPPPVLKPTEGPYWSSIAITTPTSWTTTTKAVALPDSQTPSRISPSFSPSLTNYPPSNSVTADDASGDRRPDWWGQNLHRNNVGMYAVAAITPIVVLALIGLGVFLCMRKRKRQQKEMAAPGSKVREMKMPWKPRPLSTARPYIAPPPAASPQHTTRSHDNLLPPTSVQFQPIIHGPIPSGVNGAYLTGIDTSDVVSVTSTNNLRPNPRDPFADNNSLSEPPPPYRPHSAAPPSFVSNSRQSSVRTSTHQLDTSQTHLIERSPFDDPMDEDVVSELSGPSAGQSDETLSAVSDVSYQNDPVVNRSSL